MLINEKGFNRIQAIPTISFFTTLPTVEKAGYTFAGWHLNGVKVENTTIVTTTSNYELVARWEVTTYTITYSDGTTTKSVTLSTILPGILE